MKYYIFYSPLDGMLVHRRVTPSIKFAGTHWYTWVERGTVKVKCLAQEHNAMSQASARTRTARFGGERTNHEATARVGPPQMWLNNWIMNVQWCIIPHFQPLFILFFYKISCVWNASKRWVQGRTVERGTVRVNCMSYPRTQWSWKGLEPRPSIVQCTIH